MCFLSVVHSKSAQGWQVDRDETLNGDVKVVFDLDKGEFDACAVGAAHDHSRVTKVDMGASEGVMVSTVGTDPVGGGEVGPESQREGCGRGRFRPRMTCEFSLVNRNVRF